MNRFIETLETRQLLSAAFLHQDAHHVGSASAVHADKNATTSMKFNGTANNSDGSLAANLMISIEQTKNGLMAEIVATSATTKREMFKVPVDANGNFTISRNSDKKTLLVNAAVSADQQTIAGTWTNTENGNPSNGTLSLTRTVAPTPAPKPAPKPPLVLR